MKPIDHFLERHGVDVGKAFGLLAFFSAMNAVYSMLATFLSGNILIDLTFPLGIWIGAALWRHKSWARKLLLVMTWLAVAVVAILLAIAPFTKTLQVDLTVGGTTFKNPALWHLYVFGLLLTPLLWFVLSVLHAERTRREFQKPDPLHDVRGNGPVGNASESEEEANANDTDMPSPF